MVVLHIKAQLLVVALVVEGQSTIVVPVLLIQLHLELAGLADLQEAMGHLQAMLEQVVVVVAGVLLEVVQVLEHLVVQVLVVPLFLKMDLL
jgi:hypothetical protein